MYITRRIIIALLFPAILIVSCSNNPVTTTVQSYEMYLEIGNRWEYSVNGFEIIDGDTLQIDGVLVKTVISTTLSEDSIQMFRVDELLTVTIDDSLVSTTATYFLANESNELRLYEDTVTTNFYLPVKYNAEKGDFWIPEENSPEQIEVTGLYNTIEVPFGEFSRCMCTKTTISSTPDFMHRYYWSHHAEGIVCFVEQSTNYYHVFKLTELTIN